MTSSLQEEIKSYLIERGWENLEPSDIAKSISIETAELLEEFQWKNHSALEIGVDKAKLEKISKEIADILIYSLELCIVLGLDYKKVVRKKLSIIKKKYPAKMVRGNSNNYQIIKGSYRRAGKS